MKQPVGCFRDAEKRRRWPKPRAISCTVSRGFIRTIINIWVDRCCRLLLGAAILARGLKGHRT